MRYLLAASVLLLLVSFTPPGTVRIQKLDKFLDYTEISNLVWLTYVSYQTQIADEEGVVHKPEFLPDSTLWSNLYPDDDWRYLSARNGPVTGISYHQALEYCRWRSKLVNMQYGKGKREVIYRLPTPDEIQEYLTVVNVSAKNENQGDTIDKDLEKLPSSKVSYLLSNVYEYTAEEGVYLRGGNYSEDGDYFVTELPPGAHIGFRCIAEVMK